MAKILITGGCGFLGRRLSSLLTHSGHKVYTLDNLDPLCGGSGQPDANADVRDYNKLLSSTLAFGVSHVAHLAAFGRNLTCQDHGKDAWDVNVVGTENVLKLCQSLKLRCVVCSSNIVLSDVLTTYKRTKQHTEAMVRNFASLGVSVMALRPSNIHGPGQSRTEYQPCAFAGMDIAYEHYGIMSITGDGTQTRDWTHVDDVAEAFRLALESELSGCVLDVCTGVQTSMRQIVDWLGVPVRYTDPRPGDARELVSNPQHALIKLGFVATRRLCDTLLESFPAVCAARGAVTQ